jgi:hypothetical protein
MLMHVSLDRENELVKQFIRSLPLASEAIDLELDGQVICKVVPPTDDSEQRTMIERGRELVRRARERNRDEPSKVIEREVCEAVRDVRSRKSQ